jgi:hypothetical protein
MALSSQRNRQGCNLGQEDKLAYSHKGETLKVLQPEVTLDPGEMALDIGARPEYPNAIMIMCSAAQITPPVISIFSPISNTAPACHVERVTG